MSFDSIKKFPISSYLTFIVKLVHIHFSYLPLFWLLTFRYKDWVSKYEFFIVYWLTSTTFDMCKGQVWLPHRCECPRKASRRGWVKCRKHLHRISTGTILLLPIEMLEIVLEKKERHDWEKTDIVSTFESWLNLYLFNFFCAYRTCNFQIRCRIRLDSNYNF